MKPKTYLVAVSGGIDSVVLLDVLARDKRHNLIVAHFDHGIRDDSADDARFVEELAKRYNLPFVGKREELGSSASEEKARSRRYAFLNEQAKKHSATIVTAHHADDVIETIAINLVRGTGWRGLAVMRNRAVERPLLHLSKKDIRAYALASRLEWAEDSTNSRPIYLRNQIRDRIGKFLSGPKQDLVLQLWRNQLEIRRTITNEMKGYYRPEGEYERHFFIQIDAEIAAELLRFIILRHSGATPTRPQAERAVLAVKASKPGARFQLGGGVTLLFKERTFIVQTP